MVSDAPGREAARNEYDHVFFLLRDLARIGVVANRFLPLGAVGGADNDIHLAVRCVVCRADAAERFPRTRRNRWWTRMATRA